jgi:hypothetical protein
MFNAFGNATQVPPANWQEEPATRGSWNILSSCLITLGLCLWTALHLNIPRHKEGAWRPTMRKTAWLLLGLLAPEMLAYTAWYQHRAAHKLDAVMRRKLGQRAGRTCVQKLATFFTRCCNDRKQDADREMRDVELDDRGTKDVERNTSSSRAAGRRHRWTTAHSFYAIMGGFVFDTSDADINFLPNSRQRLTLTPKGLLYLLEHEPDLVPDISEEHICDKSKASNLAKTLVCLQALWFCVQCIVRFAQGLAVSLLELNVFGHAICALLMYLLWWDKPLDIEEPTVLSGNMVREMCALMCMRSCPGASADGIMGLPELPYGVRYGSKRNIAETSVRPDKDVAIWYRLYKHVVGVAIETNHDIMVLLGRKPRQESSIPTLECRLDWTATGSVDEQPERSFQYTAYPVDLDYPVDAVGPRDWTTSSSLSSAPAVATKNDLHARNASTRSIQTLPPDASITTNHTGVDGLCLTLGTWPEQKKGDRVIRANVFVPRRPQPDYAPVSVTLSHADVVRWRLCARALQRYHPQPRWLLRSGAPSHQDFPAYRSVYDRSPNWPSSQHLEFQNRDSSLAIFLGFCLAGLVYGGLHLLAWDAPFPSHIEDKLWRSSGILLASSGFICALFLLVVAPFLLGHEWVVQTSFWQGLKTRLGRRYKPLANIVSNFGLFATGISVFLLACAYVGARGYLVVESFLQLVHLPDSAYALPGWSQYYPHIT